MDGKVGGFYRALHFPMRGTDLGYRTTNPRYRASGVGFLPNPLSNLI